MSKTTSSSPTVIFAQVNEVDRHFIRKYSEEGLLPTFDLMFRDGIAMTTRISGWDHSQERAWREISPWVVWPSIYTGLPPEQHGIIGFGQDIGAIRDRCIWDVLDSHGITTGVCGDLMSHPPRNQGACQFYFPEFLANDADCLPRDAAPMQELAVLGARNYSGNMFAIARTALWLLIRSLGAGLRKSTALRFLAQVPLEKIFGDHFTPERAMLLTYLTVDTFTNLYRLYRPQYASIHLNHVAYMQHRYWRAAEPHHYKRSLGPNDGNNFSSVDERENVERRYSGWIKRSILYTDRLLADLIRLAGPDGVVLLGSGLGQCPMDPVDQKYNPIVRLIEPTRLFEVIGLENFTLFHQMNPDLTLNFADARAATSAQHLISKFQILDGQSLFQVDQREHQLFLEHMAPVGWADSPGATIYHSNLEGSGIPCKRHIALNPIMEQSTAHHTDAGLLLAYSSNLKLELCTETVDVTAIAPTILSLFGIGAQSWMERDVEVAFEVE